MPQLSYSCVLVAKQIHDMRSDIITSKLNSKGANVKMTQLITASVREYNTGNEQAQPKGANMDNFDPLADLHPDNRECGTASSPGEASA